MRELRNLCEQELLRYGCTEALYCVQRLVAAHAFMILPFEKEASFVF